MKWQFAVILLLATLLAACGTQTSGKGQIATWCQVDDPAAVERSRQQQKLGNEALGKIACAEAMPASKRPAELILPMPCGRKMVFRAVEVALGSALDDERALFGNPDASDDYQKAMTGPWWGGVAGGFTERSDGSGKSLFYIAKYEISAPQFAIFSGAADETFEAGSPACARVDKALSEIEGTRVLPATGMSWMEAQTFADRYSTWLIGEEKRSGEPGSLLPANESRPGFLRLPTEAEWEFAARGGRETGSGGQGYVVAQDWASDGDGLPDIAWFRGGGQEPPNGSSVFYIGRKKPNAIHIFDMVGNAEEMTLDLFRPIRPDGVRLDRVGGVAVRGGGAGDSAESVGVGIRREMILYDQSGATRSPTIGFRLIISAPYFVNKSGASGKEMQGNKPLQDGISAAWGRLERGEGSAGAAARGEAEKMLQELRGKLGPAYAEQFDVIADRLRLSGAQVATREDASAEEQVLTALLAAGYGRESSRKLIAVRRQLIQIRAEGRASSPEQQAQLRNIEAMMAPNAVERDSTFDYYVQTVILLAQRPPPQVEQALSVIGDRLDRASLKRLRGLLPFVRQQIGDARKGAPSSEIRIRWIQQIEQIEL